MLWQQGPAAWVLAQAVSVKVGMHPSRSSPILWCCNMPLSSYSQDAPGSRKAVEGAEVVAVAAAVAAAPWGSGRTGLVAVKTYLPAWGRQGCFSGGGLLSAEAAARVLAPVVRAKAAMRPSNVVPSPRGHNLPSSLHPPGRKMCF